MKVKVLRDFPHGKVEVKKGEILNVKEDAVYYQDDWICDVGSPLYNVLFMELSAGVEG